MNWRLRGSITTRDQGAGARDAYKHPTTHRTIPAMKSRPSQMPAVLRWRNLLYFCLFRAAPVAYGGSQARGPNRAVAVGLCQSYSNSRSKYVPEEMMLDIPMKNDFPL